MNELIKIWQKEIDPLYIRYILADSCEKIHVQQDILQKADFFFLQIVNQMDIDFSSVLLDFLGITKKQAVDKLHGLYHEELNRQLVSCAKNEAVTSFSECFLQTYVFRQKVRIIDRVMEYYCKDSKENHVIRNYIWSEMYQLYDSISYFGKLRKYHYYYYPGYSSADDWMKECYAECILECIEKYDISRKKSFVGYTLDIFQNYRIKDAMSLLIKNEEMVVRKNKIDLDNEEIINSKKSHIDFENVSLEQNVYTQGGLLFFVFNESIEKVLNFMIYFCGKPDYRMNNSLSKKEYFRLIFSESIIQSVKICEGVVDSRYLSNEKEVFEMMNLMWVDYLMSEICRTYSTLMRYPLKCYDDILHNHMMEEIVLPASADIYTSFFKEILKLSRDRQSVAASVSRYRAKYQAQMRKIREN